MSFGYAFPISSFDVGYVWRDNWFLFVVVVVHCLRIKRICMQRTGSEESQKCPEGMQIMDEPLDLEAGAIMRLLGIPG